jgi:phosphocarrier protein FPr
MMPTPLPRALQDEPPRPPRAPLDDLAETVEWVVDYPAGLHARPASAWVEAARAGLARAPRR